MSKKKSDIDKVIEANADKIRELTAVNDALRALQEAKKKFRKPRIVAAKETA